MAKRNEHSFRKFQNDLKRKKKAEEKMARRQGRKDRGAGNMDGDQVSVLEQDKKGEPEASE